MENNNKPNFFVYGLSGAGKDTIADFFVFNHGYVKLRIARTIKAIITEKHNISFSELEVLKRTNPELRKEHNILGDQMGNDYDDERNASLNRCKQLCDGRSMDYEFIDFKLPKVVCDVRTIQEMNVFLKAGYIGIFLTKLSDEYKGEKHITENYLFTNIGNLKKLILDYPEQIQIIDNYGQTTIFPDFLSEIHYTDGTPEVLTQVAEQIILKK